MEYNFDEIRPYHDNEVNAAIQRIIENKNFIYFLNKFIVDPENFESEMQEIRNISTIHDFQGKISRKFIRTIIQSSINDFQMSGLQNIDKDKGYLFISNHRDIFLDSALLQITLFENGYNTTQNAIGNNLVITDLLMDIAKLNKMFLVKRDGNARELIENSYILSAFIEESIKQNHSVWIAQRSGRTKDGVDVTQQGLVKMLSLIGEGSIVEKIYNLNIVPISVSYEFETCDFLKARELVLSQNGKYEKQSGEDLLSIETGITQQKGRVNLVIGKPLNESLNLWGEMEGNDNEILKNIAFYIDQEILSNYVLYPNNYIAADFLKQSNKYQNFHTAEQKELFITHIDDSCKKADVNCDLFRDFLLKIYANPVFSKENLR